MITHSPTSQLYPARAFIYRPPTVPYLTVLYVDDDILVLNKPSGLLSVPGKAEAHRDCLEARASAQFPGARIVHRLDNATSGVMVLGRGRQAHRHLSMQFERRHIVKSYIARVWGHVAAQSGRVDLPLICDWPNRPLQMVDFERGKPSQTDWQVLERENGAVKVSRLRLTPLTGRSHQLRVHMAQLGHAILGDRFYAPDAALLAAGRLQLHAAMLTLRHPADGRPLTFEAPCPF